MPLEELTVHLGQSRTATTMLQTCVFPKHTSIAYLGKPFEDKNLSALARMLAWGHDTLFDPVATAGAFAEAQVALGPNRVLFLSDEAFLGPPCVPLDVLHERLSAIARRPRVIYTLRRQDDLLQSLILQQLKRPVSMTTASRLYREWMMRSHASYVGRLFYDRDIGDLIRLFGRENVLVLLYEEMISNLPAFCERLADFLGVEPREFVRLIQEASGEVNSSMSVDEASFVSFRAKHLNLGRNATIDRLGGWLFGKLNIRGDAQQTFDRIGKDAQRIYGESNRKLAEMVPYDLRQYGYLA